jgi:hypothetical protein
MKWKYEITAIEQRNDWRAAIELLEKHEVSDKELYLRVIFILLDYS